MEICAEKEVASLIATPRICGKPAVADAGAWVEKAEHYLRHEFNILGSGWLNVHYGMQAPGIAGRNYSSDKVTVGGVLASLPENVRKSSEELLELASQAVPGYTPIDWHIDIKSGYRSELVHHTQLKYGVLEGVDLKVTADLSRCYHLPVLASAWQATGECKYLDEIIAQVFDWLALNPFETGPGWRANMNVSIRVANWVATLDLLRDALDASDPLHARLVREMKKSLLEHRRYIAANLEFPEGIYHPNHYIANLSGLLLTAIVCRDADPDAMAWRNLALRELASEMERQVMGDGVDYECATAYHALVLEILAVTFIFAARLEGWVGAGEVRKWIGVNLGVENLERLEAMFIALKLFIQPNGQLPLIGDIDAGRLVTLERPGRPYSDWRFICAVGAALFENGELVAENSESDNFSAANRLFGETISSGDVSAVSSDFPKSGFYVMRGKGAYCLITAGSIGTGGKGGHSHNDKLSFTLSIDGRDIFVDPGIYVYTASLAERDAYRSVRAHNTVMVGGEEQNRFLADSVWWGCREDTHCKCLQWETRDERDIFCGAHQGYVRLDTPVVHNRKIVLDKQVAKLLVVDTMQAEKVSLLPAMKWSFMLHPDCLAEVNGDNVQIKSEAVTVCVKSAHAAWEIEDGFYSPEYGIKQKCIRLTQNFPVGIRENRFEFSWQKRNSL
jgi:uncharacterized heparinase superfamily protein